MSDKVAQNPEPAENQIWKVSSGNIERVVLRVQEDHITYAIAAGRPHGVSRDEFVRTGSCIGIVTPHGRVMVGETREGTQISSVRPRHWRVVEVVDSDVIRMTDGNVTLRFSAHVIARWPIISPPATAEQKIVASNQSCSPAYLYLFDASRIAPPFCACGLPMPSGCVMCPGCAAEKILTPKETDLYQQAIEDCNREIWRTPSCEQKGSETHEELRSRVTKAAPQTWDMVTIGGISYPAKVTEKELAKAVAIGRASGSVAFTMTLAPEEVANARRQFNMIDPREQGPGISRLPPPEVRPDVVVTEVWDRWSLP